MENYYVNNYMIQSRSEHIRETVASLNRAEKLAPKTDRPERLISRFAGATRAVLSGLMARSAKVLIEAGSTLQKHSLYIKYPGPPRQRKAA